MEEERDEGEWNGNEEMKRDLREERPSNTSDGRDVRELEARLMEEREIKGEIEYEVMVEEREMRERTKVVQSIKNTRFK